MKLVLESFLEKQIMDKNSSLSGRTTSANVENPDREVMARGRTITEAKEAPDRGIVSKRKTPGAYL